MTVQLLLDIQNKGELTISLGNGFTIKIPITVRVFFLSFNWNLYSCNLIPLFCTLPACIIQKSPFLSFQVLSKCDFVNNYIFEFHSFVLILNVSYSAEKMSVNKVMSIFKSFSSLVTSFLVINYIKTSTFGFILIQSFCCIMKQINKEFIEESSLPKTHSVFV